MRLHLKKKETNRKIKLCKTHELWNTEQEFSPSDNVDGLALGNLGSVLAASSANEITIFKTISGMSIGSNKLGGRIVAMAFDKSENKIAIANTNGISILHFGGISEGIREQKGVDFVVSAAAISPDRMLLATGSDNGRITLRNENDLFLGEVIGSEELWKCDGKVASLSLSQDGKYLAAASDDETAFLFNLEKKDRCVMAYHFGNENTVVTGFNGKRLTTMIDDRTVILWEAETGHELSCISLVHDYDVKHLAFSSKGMNLAVGGGSKVQLTNLETWHPVYTIKLDGKLNALAFNPDGNQLATASEDGTRIWDAKSGLYITVCV